MCFNNSPTVISTTKLNFHSLHLFLPPVAEYPRIPRTPSCLERRTCAVCCLSAKSDEPFLFRHYLAAAIIAIVIIIIMAINTNVPTLGHMHPQQALQSILNRIVPICPPLARQSPSLGFRSPGNYACGFACDGVASSRVWLPPSSNPYVRAPAGEHQLSSADRIHSTYGRQCES